MTCREFKQELGNQVILDSLVNPKANIFGQRVGGNDGENETNVDNSLTFHVFLKLFPQEERAYHFSYDVGTLTLKTSTLLVVMWEGKRSTILVVEYDDDND